MSNHTTSRDRYLAEAVREAEARPTVTPCHACGGNGLDRERDVDGEPLPCHWCGGYGMESTEGVDFAWTKRGAKVRAAVREYSDFGDDNLVVEGQEAS